MKTYNGKTRLVIDYQTHVTDDKCYSNVVLDEVFNNAEEAYERMEGVMPDCYDWDDGYDFARWDELVKFGDDDIFLQYAATLDDDHTFLAIFRPVLD